MLRRRLSSSAASRASSPMTEEAVVGALVLSFGVLLLRGLELRSAVEGEARVDEVDEAVAVGYSGYGWC